MVMSALAACQQTSQSTTRPCRRINGSTKRPGSPKTYCRLWANRPAPSWSCRHVSLPLPVRSCRTYDGTHHREGGSARLLRWGHIVFLGKDGVCPSARPGAMALAAPSWSDASAVSVCCADRSKDEPTRMSDTETYVRRYQLLHFPSWSRQRRLDLPRTLAITVWFLLWFFGTSHSKMSFMTNHDQGTLFLGLYREVFTIRPRLRYFSLSSTRRLYVQNGVPLVSDYVQHTGLIPVSVSSWYPTNIPSCYCSTELRVINK